jgi:predicted nucleotidyltransferase/HEPN domain-containing protein
VLQSCIAYILRCIHLSAETPAGRLVLVHLPENVRQALQKLTHTLSKQEATSGVGLFGSWSRGDASPQSDVDLLIIEKQSLMHECVERIVVNDLFIDLDYLPRKWVSLSLPPEIDQKLFETLVLYDRDWALTNAKDWIHRTYRNPERMNIRCEMHLVDADIYISRASSALTRGDYPSACVFAGLGLESAFKVIVEAGLLPFSTSRFIHVLEEAAEKLDCPRFLDIFLDVSALTSVSHDDAERCLRLCNTTWDYGMSFLQEQEPSLSSLHQQVKDKLNYFGNMAFLKGVKARAKGIINSGNYKESCYYVRRNLLDFLENCAWAAAYLEGIRLDSSMLFSYLETSKEFSPKLFEAAATAFGLQSLTPKKAEVTVKLARETVFEVHRAKMELLQNCVEKVS